MSNDPHDEGVTLGHFSDGTRYVVYLDECDQLFTQRPVREPTGKSGPNLLDESGRSARSEAVTIDFSLKDLWQRFPRQ